jgi:OmpA-OmpF porin, OOP family
MVKYIKLLIAVIYLGIAAVPAQGQESPPSDTSQHPSQWSSRDMTYRGQNYDPLDTAFIPKYRMPQQKKFLNHQYFFPAKPQSMWEIGLGYGNYNVIGNVPALNLWQKGGYAMHFQVRKSLGYVFSMRMQYMYGIAKGLDYQPNYYYGNNPAWTSTGYSPAANPQGNKPQPIVNNFRMESHQFNLDFMINLNNIKFHNARTKLSCYVFGGISAFAYGTRVNTLDANALKYDFKGIIGTTPITYDNKGTIRSALQAAMGSDYNVNADNNLTTSPKLFGKKLDFAASVGIGAQYRINQRINIQLEERFSMPGDNLLDGVRWSESSNSSLLTKSDFTNYFSAGINFNLGSKKKNVEPLYWLNPLEYAYNEMNTPRHMILPDAVLPDSDGDGVADQFDKCPGTPPGVAVDSHGCPMDTDGDGVPDFRDKQLITPTECQPVDADGVGKCPCPEGCGGTTSTCGNIGSGTVNFPTNSANIGAAMQLQLATLAAQMQANPTCKVVITGAGRGNKQEQQRSWDRVNAIIQYMSEKNGINRNRFIFQYGQSGSPETVIYRAAMPGEEGPSGNVAPPFPNLMQKDK